jgi:hypothetical protein
MLFMNLKMIRFILCTTVIVMWKYDYLCACTVPWKGKKLQQCKLVLHTPYISIRQRVSERSIGNVVFVLPTF